MEYIFIFSSVSTPLLHYIMKAINKDVMKDVIHAMDEPLILAKVAMESKSSKMGQQLGKIFDSMVTMATRRC